MFLCWKKWNEVENRDEKEEKYCEDDDYKGLRSLCSRSEWSDDKNMTPWQSLDKCGRFLRTISRNIPSSRSNVKKAVEFYIEKHVVRTSNCLLISFLLTF